MQKTNRLRFVHARERQVFLVAKTRRMFVLFERLSLLTRRRDTSTTKTLHSKIMFTF